METIEVSVGVLGPLQVFRGNVPVTVSGNRQATILVTLALSAGRPVSHQMLADRAWSEQLPHSVESSLHSHISRLRQVLGPDSIRTMPAGYLLDVDPNRVDALRFRHQVEQAVRGQDPDEVRTMLEDALGLWRGEPFAGLRSEIFHRDLAPSLIEDHLRAVERRNDLYLAAGRHGELIAELQELIRRYPLRETLWRQLITAQANAGRPADALDSYHSVRTELRERLGTTPSEELQALYHRLLSSSATRPTDVAEPHENARTGPRPMAPPETHPADGRTPDAPIQAPTTPPTVPRQLPPDIGDFVGREHEISQILTKLGTRGSGSVSRIVVLSGPGGIGKTALAIHTGHQVGTAFPDGHLYADMQGAGANPVRMAHVIARFLRALGVSASSIPDAMSERVNLYRRLLADRRLLLVLDNVKDESQIRDLLPTNADSAVIVTSRRRMAGLWGGHLIELGVLSECDGARLLGRAIGAVRLGDQVAGARRLVQLSGGLPLALRIIGARLVAKPHWRLDVLVERLADTRDRLNELTYGDLDVRASLALSYGGLSGRAKAMLQRLSLLTAPDFPLWAGAALLDIGLDEAEVLYECLIDAQLLDVVDGPCGPRYKLHDLVAAYARERVLREEGDAVREGALRRAFGGWLALVEYADRRLHGGDFGVVHGVAARWYPDSYAVCRVIDVDPLAWLDAERFAIGAAVRQAAASGFDELCWDLAWTAEILFEAHGYFDDWRACQAHALRAARQAGNVRGEAAMLTSMAALLIKQHAYDEAAELGHQALVLFDQANDGAGRGCIADHLGLIELMRGNLDAAASAYELARKALDAADRCDTSYSLQGLAQVALERGDLDSAECYLLEGLEIAERTHGPRPQAMILNVLGGLRMSQQRFGEAAAAFKSALDLVRSYGDVAGEAHVLGGFGKALAAELDDQAEPVLQDALEIARRLGERHMEARTLLSLGELATARGHTDSAFDYLKQSLWMFQEISTPLWENRAQLALDSWQRGCDLGKRSYQGE